MKTIGLIGGMSWESTMHYYQRINELVAARLGGPAHVRHRGRPRRANRPPDEA
jgi:aspartate/glutamate racemase